MIQCLLLSYLTWVMLEKENGKSIFNASTMALNMELLDLLAPYVLSIGRSYNSI